MADPQEWDANGKPIPATPAASTAAPAQPQEWDASGKPIAPAAAPAQPEGFWHSLGAQLGITPEAADAARQELLAHPLKALAKAAGGPAVSLAESLYGQGKQTASELYQAGKSVVNGNPADAAVHAVQSVPIVGPAINKMAANAPVANPSHGYLHQVVDDITPGNFGTALGAAAQAAPIVAGGIEKVPGGDAALAKVAAPVQAVADATANATRGAVAATGQAAENAGTGLMNKTVGTLKSDFKRGANPARGYFATDNGPSLNMQSIADKASASLDDTGAALGNAYQSATAKGTIIPFDTVAEQMAKPLQKALDLETGPGGTGNTASIKAYIDQFEPAFAKAQASGGFTPSELFDIKQSIAKNTNWSDPTQFNLKTVRQQQVGAISGILSDAVPETQQLNQNYQDLTKLADRATERAATGSRPLTAHIYKAGATMLGAAAGAADGHPLLGAAAGTVLDSVPFKTTLATGLVKGGRALQSIASPTGGATAEGVSANDLGSDSANAENNNPQSTPPRLGNGSTTNASRWASEGYNNVVQHLGIDPSSGIARADLVKFAQTPQGKSLLTRASSLSPGSPAMRSLVQQIKTNLGASQ